MQLQARSAMDALATSETERSFLACLEHLPREGFTTKEGPWSCAGDSKQVPARTWGNRSYLAMLFPVDGAALGRLTVQRTRSSILLRPASRDDRSLSWEELQHVKDGVGFGEYWAVEIYPPAIDCVNVSNMRHLWLVEDVQVPFAWRSSDGPNFFNNRS